MIHTLNDIASSEEFKADLRRIIDDPTLQTALRVLERENMPSFVVHLAPGMDAMQSVALDYAQRCGAQALIKRLMSLPSLTNKKIDQAKIVGQPWEYLTAKEEPEVTAL